MKPVKICVVGWYGTETIGDRAILAGLFSVFAEAFGDFSIKLGSLHPFFSQRTLSEDASLWRAFAEKEVKVDLFDSKCRNELNAAIKDCDFVIMGGGPLMDLHEMFMVEYAFKKAKRLGKKTALLGCGVGPLFQDQFKQSLLNIVDCSDMVLFRDKASVTALQEICGQFGRQLSRDVIASIDPAALCVQEYIKRNDTRSPSGKVCINLRDFPGQCFNLTDKQNDRIHEKLVQTVRSVCTLVPDKEVILVPMHYFYIGGDDREYFGRIKQRVGVDNLLVQHQPVSLEGTMKMFREADWCVGMRFHSIVLQTLLNGRNFILDYTEPGKGKIAGVIADLDMTEFYENRYVSLHDLPVEQANALSLDQMVDSFPFPKAALDHARSIYTALIQEQF